MRVLMVLCALVAAPFVAGVSQGGHDAQQCGLDWHAQHQTHANSGKHLGWAKQVLPCPPAPPPPAPPPPVQPPPPPPPPPGMTIDGVVFNSTTFAGLSGWSVVLSGTVSATGATVSATVQTGADGSYIFTGLQDGTYTVCEAVQSGWSQTFPDLAHGIGCVGPGLYPVGYPVSLSGGMSVSFIKFGNSNP
jgi:hypothetical protein